jgi:hypothetical protein
LPCARAPDLAAPQDSRPLQGRRGARRGLHALGLRPPEGEEAGAPRRP